MEPLMRLLSAAITAILLCAGATQMQTTPGPELWEGKLEMPGGVSLRILLHVLRARGEVRGSMDSPDQGALGIPLETISFARGQLQFSSRTVGCSYAGTLSSSGKEATGTFTQVGAKLALALHQTDQATALRRPQTPHAPFPYREEEVAYDNLRAQVADAATQKLVYLRLAGTLLLPRGPGPFPAVVLITGSGPQDRDETLMGHKPFWVLADALGRRGIAVLRVDDRGIGASTGDFSQATSADFADDVDAGLAYLHTRKEIDPQRIGLLGHSEGAMIAPMVATRAPVAFIVMLSGPGVPGDELILTQADLLARAMGKSEAERTAAEESQRKLFDLVKSEPDLDKLEAKARPLIEARLDALPEAEKAAMGDRTRRTRALLAQLTSPWLRFFVAYDPRPAISKLHCPVLAIGGSKDMQLPAKKNLAEIAAALKKGGDKDVTTRELPGLNHLLQTAPTGMPTEYAAIEETMAPQALKLIGDWIVAHAKAR